MAGHVAKLEIRILGEIREFLIENTQSSFEEQMREVKKFVTLKINKAFDSTEELLSVEGNVQSLVTMQSTDLSKWNCDLVECRKCDK